VDFNAGKMDCGDGITDGITVMCIGSGIDNNAGIVVAKRVKVIDDGSLMVGLEETAIKTELLCMGGNFAVDAVKSIGAVDAGLTFAGEVDIGTIDNGNFGIGHGKASFLV